jgi:hypothetical protein
MLKLLTNHVEWTCYVYHKVLQSTNTPWWVGHQGVTPMVSADPSGYPDPVAPDLTTFLATHTDNSMCHHSFKNKQTDEKCQLETNITFGTTENKIFTW